MKKIWNAVTSFLVITVVVLATLLIGVRLVGITPYVVLSGSMEPTYHVGSLIYVKKVDPFELTPGDTITYMLDEETLSTHRIVEVIPDEDDTSVIRFRTKGDANDVEDATLVHYKNVVGKPIFTIPYLGYIADYIKNPPGRYIAIVFAALLLMLMFIPDLFDEDKTDKKNKKKKTKKKHHRGRRRKRGNSRKEKS